MCSFLQARYLQIATVVQLHQLKSGNELSHCFGAFVEIEELKGGFGVWLIDQLHLWDGKGVAEELRGTLQKQGEWVKSIPLLSYHFREKTTTNSSQSGTAQDRSSTLAILCFDFLCSIQS